LADVASNVFGPSATNPEPEAQNAPSVALGTAKLRDGIEHS
jgi:hypothetical protein